MKVTPTQSTRLTALEARQAELEKRIAHLEREVHRNFPNPWVTPIGPFPSAPPVFPQPMEDMDDARCHVCNGRYKDMTHYVCGYDRCPSRVTCGDTLQPTFICGGTTDSTSTTAGALNTPKNGVGPYGALGTICMNGGKYGNGEPSFFGNATIHSTVKPIDPAT